MVYTTYTEDFIKDMYNKIGITKPHQLHLLRIANALGIKVFYWKQPSQALFDENYGYIFLNEKLSTAELWQDFCHELSHVLQQCGNQGYKGKIPRSWIEYQENKANNFMYHACMPSFMLDALNITDYNFSTIISLQKLFNVEYEFALKRIIQYLNNKKFYHSIKL